MSFSILAWTDGKTNRLSRLVIPTFARSPKLASGGAPGVGSVIWCFMVGLSVLERRVGINDGISGLNLKKI